MSQQKRKYPWTLFFSFQVTVVMAPVCLCAVTNSVVSEVVAGCSGHKEDLIVVIGSTWVQCSTGYKRPSFLAVSLSLRP